MMRSRFSQKPHADASGFHADAAGPLTKRKPGGEGFNRSAVALPVSVQLKQIRTERLPAVACRLQTSRMTRPIRPAETTERREARARLFADRRIWIMAAYGLLSGLPLPLSGFTLRLWLSEGHLSLGLIGLTANIGLAYSLKFLWAPLLDQARPPWLLRRLGRRRGWLLAIQPALAGAAVLLALSRPAAAPSGALAAAALVAFLSASQDIVVDAWRIESFPPRLQGAAMAAYVWAYRVALLISGAGAIKAADVIGWHGALLAVAGVLALGPVVTLLAPEPPVAHQAAPTRLIARLKSAIVSPLLEMLGRSGAGTILGFVALFKLGEAMAGVMTAPFYTHLGFDRAAIAVANGPFSLAATFAGTAGGRGWWPGSASGGRCCSPAGCRRRRWGCISGSPSRPATDTSCSRRW